MNLLLTLAVMATVAASPPAPTLKVEKHQLDNGLTLLVSEDHRLPVVAVEVRYMVGSAHERPGRTGFAHLFEHLMFQGSAHFDDEYFKPFEPIGAAINGTTSMDRTNYYERVPANYLEQVLWMESDRMANLLPALTQAKLDNQRDVVKNERRQNYEDRPYGLAVKHLNEKVFPEGHPYHHLTIGSHEDLTAATLEDVRAFFRQYYTPANAVVTIVGDVQPDEAQKLVEKYFGHIPAGERAPKPDGGVPELAAIQHVVDEDEVKLPRVYLAWPTPALYADGDAALDILSSVLTDGKTSRLYKPLVYDKKIAKDVTAFQWSRQLGSMYVIQATAVPGKTADELADALLDTLKEALAKPPSDDELARAVNGWRKSFYGMIASVLDRAQLLSTYFHIAGKPDYLAKDLERYTSLTPDKVHAAAQKYLTPGKFVRVDIVPAAAKGDAGAEGGAK